MNSYQHIQKFHIFGYDTDCNCNLTPARLVSMMHETAWAHVNKMHVGWSDLQKENLFWVITKVSINIRKLPKWNDEIEIKTTAIKQKMIIYPRDYEVFDSNGDLIAEATSEWALLKTDGTLVRSNEKVNQLLRASESSVSNCKTSKLPRIPFEENLPVYAAQLSDLDMNNHVNNVSYIRWILDLIPADFYQSHTIQKIDVNYTSQLKWGEKYAIAIQHNDNEWNFTIYTDSGREVSRISTLWS